MGGYSSLHIVARQGPPRQNLRRRAGLAAVVAIVMALPASAQLRTLTVSFDGIGCASCVASLAPRLKRLRGVEAAEVDAVKGCVTLRLAPENRVRIEQVRDAIEQDGTRATHALVEATGRVVPDGEEWFLEIPGVAVRYRLAGSNWREGTATIRVETTELRPATPPLTLRQREAAEK
jgi:copper chaperone CopZ